MGLVFASFASLAQNFSSGSDGSYGILNVIADTTLDVPDSGVFNCTTINVASGKVLKFRRNAANTPVHLLATGDVSVAGRIDVSGGGGNNVVGGIAGPGGFDGGSPGSVSVPPGAGYGPGSGRGGTGGTDAAGGGGGSFGTVGSGGASTNKGGVYANALLIPLVGGSGGGGTSGTPGNGGGGGGGAILVASSTRVDISGSIIANGGGGSYTGGSGGAIRIVAPIVSGNGQLAVNSPFGCGYGRIRIDAINRTQLNLNFDSAQVTSVGSLMMVFSAPLPRLDIVEAAGTAIPEGSGPVLLQLPFGSSPNRTIKVQARDFNTQVPVTLVLTPDHGNPVTYVAKINNASGQNPAVLPIDVVLPVNEQVTVNVFSK
jgi:hypothetical protein